MILKRIKKAVDSHLSGRSTVSQILALRRVIKGVKAKQIPAIRTFIDFKKAFDSIRRGKMIKILRAYDVPENLSSAIEKILKNESNDHFT